MFEEIKKIVKSDELLDDKLVKLTLLQNQFNSEVEQVRNEIAKELSEKDYRYCAACGKHYLRSDWKDEVRHEKRLIRINSVYDNSEPDDYEEIEMDVAYITCPKGHTQSNGKVN